MTTEDSEVFGQILSVILEKHEANLKKDSKQDWITFKELIVWVAWPNYLEVMVQGS